jgi:peptide/nickel transport system substrate-binding protein/oligopeptide transport system substrate-binding protein
VRALALLLAALVSSLLACAVPLDPPPAGPATGEGPPHTGGVLRLSSAADVRTLDPAAGYDETSWLFEQMLFDTLVGYDESTNIVPQLAASWEVSPDGRRYTFQLRDGVRFNTGRPCTAADVKYSLERVLTPTVHSLGTEFFAGIDGAAEFASGRAPDVRGIEVMAPNRLAITLVEADPLFLDKLTMPFASAVDRETIELEGQGAFVRHPVGTGAFRLVEWVQGQRLRLERNAFYYRAGLPYLDGIEATIGLSDQLAWFRFQRGGLDVAAIPSAEFFRVTSDPRYTPLLVRRVTMRTQYLGLNCAMAPFDRLTVRDAVARAIDKERVLQLLDGRGVVAHTILPPTMPGYDPELTTPAYDPGAARRELASVDPHGVQVTLWSQRDDGALRVAQSIQQDLAAIGMAVRIKPVDFPALIEAVRYPAQVPMFLLGWEADFPDPSNFLTVLLHSRGQGRNNNSFYGSRAVDALLDLAGAEPAPARRHRLFRKAEARILRDVPWVPLYHPASVVVRHPRVRGYALHPLRPARFETVWVAW